jgi:hypothetical protein
MIEPAATENIAPSEIERKVLLFFEPPPTFSGVSKIPALPYTDIL